MKDKLKYITQYSKSSLREDATKGKIYQRQVEASTPPIVPKRTKTNQPRLRTKGLVDRKMVQPTEVDMSNDFLQQLVKESQYCATVKEEAHKHT